MLESRVVFLPRLGATDRLRRSPLGAYSYTVVLARLKPHLIDENQLLGLNRRSHHHPPGSSSELLTLRCGSSPFFPACSKPGYGAPHSRATHREPTEGVYVLATLLEGGQRPLLQVRLQQLRGFLIHSFGADPGLLFLGALEILRGRLSLGSASARRGSRLRCGPPGSWRSHVLRQ